MWSDCRWERVITKRLVDRWAEGGMNEQLYFWHVSERVKSLLILMPHLLSQLVLDS